MSTPNPTTERLAQLLEMAAEARTETPDYPDLLDLVEELAEMLRTVTVIRDP